MIQPIAKPTPRRKEPKPLKARVRSIAASVKQQVFDRDNWTCRWCETPGGALDAHHVLRRSQGGKDVVENLVSVHRICHRTIHENPTEAKRRGFLAGGA